MNAHQIDGNGLILNTTVVAELGPDMIDASIGGGPGDSIINGFLIPKEVVPVTLEEINASILAQLQQIDAKSIRALREGDAMRIAMLEEQAATLRLTLRKV